MKGLYPGHERKILKLRDGRWLLCWWEPDNGNTHGRVLAEDEVKTILDRMGKSIDVDDYGVQVK